MNEDSLLSLLYLFNRIWGGEGVSTSITRSHIDPHPKTWKRSNKPSQLSTDSPHELERMFNARLVYQMEKNRCIPLLQSSLRLFVRKKRLTACLTSALFTKRLFRRDSSSKPETDESHLVRNQDCVISTPSKELQYGFASVDSHCHPTTECQI
ncbi:hypothetical protein TNCV_2273651 [Trichonephila clavipes]|nr:hypothetical protein TNCV_2273651 [Trichonephila clavipes]